MLAEGVEGLEPSSAAGSTHPVQQQQGRAAAGPAVHFIIALVLMFSILFVAGDTRN